MPTLNWIGKDKIINHDSDVPCYTFDKKYTFNSNESENMIIHGDNLIALKSLLPKYEGMVDCIYIDPPYNTGKKEGYWVYYDNVNDPQFEKKEVENNSINGNSSSISLNRVDLSNYSDDEISKMNELYTQHRDTADDIIVTAEQHTKEFEQRIKQIPDNAISEEVKLKMKTSKLKQGFAEIARGIKLPQFYKINSSYGLFGSNDKLLTKGMLNDKYSLNSVSLPKNLTEINNNVFVYDIDEFGESSELSRRTIDLHYSDWGKVLSMYDDEKKVVAIVQKITSMLSKKFDGVSDNEIRDYLTRIFKGFSVDDLDHVIQNTNAVVESIKKHIASDMEKYRIQKFKELIDKNQIELKPSFEFLPEINAIDTSNKISKSLYESEPSINLEEEKAITNIASLENVIFWHHIRQKAPGEFYINGYIYHYPDFVIYTKKGNIVLVEFKGEDRKNEDSQLKVKLGRKWDDLAGPNYRYFMVFLDEAFKEDGAYNLADALDIIRNL